MMHSLQFLGHFFLRKCQRTTENRGDAMILRGNEGPDEHPGAIWKQHDFMAMKMDGFHTEKWGGGMTNWSALLISANDNWKARDDSAPWFALTRSGWSPSPQPPVEES